MIKKFLLPLMFMASMSMATELSTEFYFKGTYTNGAVDVLVSYQNDEDRDIRDKTKDWIAVYKKDSSTQWKNVITWAWVRDLSGEAPGDDYGHIFKDTHLTEAGEYSIRFFKNNSYTVDKSLDFTIKKVNSFLVDIKKTGIGYIRTIGFDNDKFVPNKKDWIAVFKEGDNNTWENVVQWAWTEDLKEQRHYKYYLKLDENLYEEGVKYQARYFLNNTYSTFKKTESFYVGELPDDEKKVLSYAWIDKRDGVYKAGAGVYSKYFENGKDWVGIFNDDVEHTDISNLIAWKYVSKDDPYGFLEVIKPDLINKEDTYRAVFFRNDTYLQFGKKMTFKVR